MHSNASAILWVYILLLILGGLMGFLKAKSKVSLIMSVAFAAGLSLCAGNVIGKPLFLAVILLTALFVVFGIRLAKTKKFMPAGLMLILSVVTLVLLHFV